MSEDDYREQTSEASSSSFDMLHYNPIAETTPSQEMSPAAKRRVDKETDKPGLTNGRCLIENTAESNEVEYAHCLPRSTKSDLLDRLEFAWKMEPSTLNVDSRYNVLRLSPKFHRAFDAGQWLLLPETSIIKEYHNALKKDNLPDINNEVYTYKLLAFSDMAEIPIHRQKFPPPEPPLRPSAADFTYYPHPYHNFPLLVSHVHPRFVICNSGPKIPREIAFLQEEYKEYSLDIAMVLEIWQAWTEPIPEGASVEKLKESQD